MVVLERIALLVGRVTDEGIHLRKGTTYEDMKQLVATIEYSKKKQPAAPIDERPTAATIDVTKNTGFRYPALLWKQP